MIEIMHKHAEIEQYLMEQIQEGTMKEGDRLETEEELSRRFGVSRPTVRQALRSLEQRGYLKRIKGSGTFVTEPKLLHTSTSFIASYQREAEQQGHTVITQVLSLEIVRGEEKICKKLGVKKNTSLYRMVRVRRIKECHHGAPVVYTVVYIPVCSFPQMGDQDFTKTSLYDTLEKYGLRVCHVSKLLEVVPGDETVKEALEIGAWEPVIKVSSVGYLQNGEAVEYAESWYPAQSSQFLVEL